jgi:hypothetical protein
MSAEQDAREVAAAKAAGERAAEAMDRQPVPDSPQQRPAEQLAEVIREQIRLTIPGAN